MAVHRECEVARVNDRRRVTLVRGKKAEARAGAVYVAIDMCRPLTCVSTGQEIDARTAVKEPKMGRLRGEIQKHVAEKAL